ncbi:MRC1-like domain-containing protein [Boletus edulis]|nr:MRC1-like domain-containing protein [Boletus edulis]
MDANTDDSSRPIKRAPVVYGKRSNFPPPAVMLPVDGQHQSFERRRGHHGPSQRRRSLSPSVHASDSEHSRSPAVADPFQFGFKHRLKELDEEFDHRDVPSYRPSPSPSREAVCVGPSQVKDPQSVSMGTPILSSEARRSSGSLSPTSSPPPTSLHTTSAQEHPPESPVVHRRARRVANPVSSDSEVAVPRDSSSVSPVRHAITTPHSRSSPTPPTSSEIPMVSRKSKGKAPARDVLPLVFDGERPLAVELPIKSKKMKRIEPLVRPKTRAPTKKERREVAFESSRIAANRPVEVIHTQEQKHSMAAFFGILRRDDIMIPTPGAELPSDPIERFSSPTDNSTRVPPLNTMFGAPTRILRASTHVGTSNRPSSEAFPPAADDSDDEMPSVTSIIQQESGKWQRLQAMKQVALQHGDNKKAFDVNSEDEDEDLLIVNDDMHAVAREEAAQRRLDKAHGSPVKNIATLRRINHPSVRPVVVSPRKLSKQALHELAQPSFARPGKSLKGQLTKKQLDQLMIMQHTEEQLKSIKRHEEEWVKGGGRLSRDTDGDGPQTSLSQKLGVYAELGLKAMDTGGAVEDEASADESDEDYTLDLRGSASPKPRNADEGDSEPSDKMEISQVPQPQIDDDGDEEVVAPLRRHKSGQRHPRVVLGSDDEERPLHVDMPSVQRDSTSSMESQTEDENDKENSVGLMYDRSEDKENKAVVRHELSSPEMTFGSRLGSVQAIEDGARRNLSLASAADFNETTSSSNEDVRLPLKDISKDDDDLFLPTPSAHAPFTEGHVHSAAILPPRLSTSTLSLGSPPLLRSERIGRIKRLSLGSENDENDPSGFKPLQPSFLERLRSQVSPEPSLAPIHPLPNGGFSQLFSAEDRTLTKPVGARGNDDLSLTLDVGLKPALEVNGTLRQKAETIFKKEQEYVVAAAAQQIDRPKDPIYVNDYGFLTQTRPEGSSPQVYRMTPSQASKFIGTQVHSTLTQPLSARPPLRTLSFTVSPELSPEPQPLRRLRKRSLSPLEQKFLGQNSNPVEKLNAFDILGKAPKPPPPKAQGEELGKSEFVVFEAEESDEDDMFGFGGPKKDDGEEEDDNEQDKIVEGLVDDAVMDAETEAPDLVLEKHREHVEEDDERLQKLHQDAVEGKFRMKRRGGGVDVEYESDEDDDDEARRIRQRMRKKRKIEGDSLEALGQNEETRAFYNTYHQDLIDENDEFGHLREDAAMPADDDDDAPAAEPEEQETVSVDEIRQRVREIAQSNLEVELLDPENTSWIDQSMMIEADDAVRVKVVDYRRSKPVARHPNAGQVDFDAEPGRHVENEQARKQMTSWAKNQSHRRQGTGRSGNSAAITGHTKVKTGGGSLRSKQTSNAASVSEARKTKTPSLLSMVPNRSGKFA